MPDEKSIKVSWWKQPSNLFSLQGAQSKSSTVWTIAFMAAFVGFVVVGYRWQCERSRNHQLKLDLIAKEEVKM